MTKDFCDLYRKHFKDSLEMVSVIKAWIDTQSSRFFVEASKNLDGTLDLIMSLSQILPKDETFQTWSGIVSHFVQHDTKNLKKILRHSIPLKSVLGYNQDLDQYVTRILDADTGDLRKDSELFALLLQLPGKPFYFYKLIIPF
jgi:hypothetical protein